MHRQLKSTLALLLILSLANCTNDSTLDAHAADQAKLKEATSPGHGKYKHPYIVDCIMASTKLSKVMVNRGHEGHTESLAEIYLTNGAQINKYCHSAILYIREDADLKKNYKSEMLWKLIYYYDEVFKAKPPRKLKS